MPVFFPFAIPQTSSYAISASVAMFIDNPTFTMAYTLVGKYGNAGPSGSSLNSCPDGYTEVNYSLIAYRPRNYLLCHSPTPTPTPTPTVTNTPTPTNTTAAPTATPTPTNTTEAPTATPTPTNTTEAPTATPTPTATPSCQANGDNCINNGNCCSNCCFEGLCQETCPTATPTPTNTTAAPTATPTPTTACAGLGDACDSGGSGAPTCCEGYVCDDGDGTGGNLGVCVAVPTPTPTPTNTTPAPTPTPTPECITEGGNCESTACCEGLTCFYNSGANTYTCIL